MNPTIITISFYITFVVYGYYHANKNNKKFKFVLYGIIGTIIAMLIYGLITCNMISSIIGIISSQVLIQYTNWRIKNGKW